MPVVSHSWMTRGGGELASPLFRAMRHANEGGAQIPGDYPQVGGRIMGDPARNDALASIDWCARHKGREYCHGEQERTNGGERPKSRADKP